MKFISIPSYSICQLIVDDSDYEFLSKFRWWLSSKGYAKTKIDGKPITLGRLLLNPSTGILIDHIDHNKLNYQRSNLRLATDSQNSANRKKYYNTSSSYKGVSWHKTKRKWIAQVGNAGKKLHLGTFNSELEAAKAYNKSAIELFGEFALLNSFNLGVPQ